MSPNTRSQSQQSNNYSNYNNSSYANNCNGSSPDKEEEDRTQLSLGRRKGSSKSRVLTAMKILSLILILVVLFRETRHQFLVPSFPLLLATEEFIEPESPALDQQKSQIHDNEIPQISNSPTGHEVNLPVTPTISDSKKDEKTLQSIKEDPLSPVVIPTTEGNLKQESVVTFVDTGNGVSSTLNPLSPQDEKLVTDPPPLVNTESTEGNVSKTGEVKEKSREEEEPIPSYMEWAQKKQLELITNSIGQNGQSGNIPSANAGNNNGHSASGQGNGNRSASQLPSSSGTSIDANLKNFASPDCGAKVVQSNSGSTNPSGVLSSSHDEYMLNKCGIPVWFVVELCEPLTIEKVSLGNLELFSSSPKEFEVGISDRYPTREWVKLGPFPLPDARAIHPIVLPSTNASTFGKFLKVSILSHHGSEHYCPLSVIRVNGKSEYEVLESETTHQEDTDNEENSLHEEQLYDQPRSKTNEKSVVGRAKDAVLNIVNAVKAFSGLSGMDSSSLSLQSKCQSIVQCIPSSSMKDEIYALLSCNSSNLLPFLSTHSPWCGWDYCHAIFSRQSIGLPWQPEGFFASLFGGPSVLHALCHYNKPLKEGCDPMLPVNNSISDSSSTLSDINGDHYINDSLNPVNPSTNGLNLTEDESSQTQALPSTPQEESADPQVSPPKSDTASTESSPDQQVEAPQVQSVPGFLLPETQIPAPNPNQAEETAQSIPQQVAGGSQQKESTFVRLANRIKTLERNQSLTASYLEELSRRFKKQNEDNSILNESNKKVQNDTRVKLLQMDEYYRQELQSLRRNVDDVRERLFTVQLQRSLLVIVCFSQTLLIVGGCIWVKRRIRDIQSQTQLDSISSPVNEKSETVKAKVFNSEVDANRHIVGRKRSNSDVTPSSMTEKSKKMKKKKRNNVGGDTTRTHNNRPTTGSNPLLQNSKANILYNFSGTSSFSKPKENVDPHRNATVSNINSGTAVRLTSSNGSSPINSPSYTLPMSAGFEQRPSSLLTKVDSPFTFHSALTSSAGSYLDSGVSASGRFALLASPGQEPPGRFFTSNKEGWGGMKRTGSSGSSAASSSTNNTTSDKHGTKVILNGHSADSVSSGKKGKKVGLKAFMPKIFDR